MSRRDGADEDERLTTEDHSSCATYSAIGATSLRHVSEVSQSSTANDEAMRQFPLRSSQKVGATKRLVLKPVQNERVNSVWPTGFHQVTSE